MSVPIVRAQDTFSIRGSMVRVRVTDPHNGTIRMRVYANVLPANSALFTGHHIHLNERHDVVEGYIFWRMQANGCVLLPNTWHGSLTPVEETFLYLAESYLFADQVPDVGYRRAVTEAVVATAQAGGGYPCIDTVQDIYDGTAATPHRRIRRLYAFLFACRANNEQNLRDLLNDQPRPAAMVNDCLSARMDIRNAAINGLLAQDFQDP